MKKLYTCLSGKGFLSLLACGLLFNTSFAQNAINRLSLGTVKDFTNSFLNADHSTNNYILKIASSKEVTVSMSESTFTENNCHVFGKLVGYEAATFFINGDERNITGKVIFQKTKEAYDIYTSNAGEVFITPIDINKVICTHYEKYKEEDGDNKENGETASKNNNETMVAPLLQSLPGSARVIYLDFDGENVSGGNWGTINAAPSGFSNAKITTIWTAIAEDYSPYDVNITTDLAVYTSAPSNRRMMCIFTPTDDALPGSGGVAYLNSFGTINPCWAFNSSTKPAFEAGSHECGHTAGLSHDGTSTQEYYGGQGNWGPIMGATYSHPIAQWSKGEYTDANQQQDDVVIINNKIPYRIDDHGNTPAAASGLLVDASGNVAASGNFGVIEKRTDVDVFKFTTTGGNVSLSIVAKTESGSTSIPDLDIQARLLNSSGTELAKVSPTTAALTTPVAVLQNLTAGTYYLEIDGVGNGDPLTTGYSDYGSLGQYFISGNVPGGISIGINEAENNHAINIFPNPSSGVFNIHIPLNGTNENTIEVLNSLGQPVLISSENSSGNMDKKIDLSSYAAGIYCVVVKSGSDVWKGKVLLK